jgi:arsenite-transporting ATPase
LRVDRIEPIAETQRYVDKFLAARGLQLEAQEKALLFEDLRSPCTQEAAVFHAFSRVVSEGGSAFVVLEHDRFEIRQAPLESGNSGKQQSDGLRSS